MSVPYAPAVLRRRLPWALGKMKKRVEQLEGELFAFIKKYSRKSQRRTEPNDRRYDRKIEKWLKTAKPDELSKLLNQEEKNEDQS